VCETWSVTLREAYILRVLENRVLKKIFGPEREDLAGDCTRLHNEEFHNSYISPNIIIKVIKSRGMKWAGHIACIGEMRNGYTILIRKLEGKRPHRRPRCRWEDNI
jgi:hypothetical protein